MSLTLVLGLTKILPHTCRLNNYVSKKYIQFKVFHLHRSFIFKWNIINICFIFVSVLIAIGRYRYRNDLHGNSPWQNLSDAFGGLSVELVGEREEGRRQVSTWSHDTRGNEFPPLLRPFYVIIGMGCVNDAFVAGVQVFSWRWLRTARETRENMHVTSTRISKVNSFPRLFHFYTMLDEIALDSNWNNINPSL